MDIKKIALFAAGTLFGSAGFKLLSSKDAKKVSSSTIRVASILLPGLMMFSRTRRAGYGWVLIRAVSS